MIKLPHELLEPENEHLLPSTSKGKRLKSYRLTYDPQVAKDDKKGKHALKDDLPVRTRDPRERATAIRRPRRELRLPTFKWDTYSTLPKPPPPPHSIVISGLSPLMTEAQIRQSVRPFGRVNAFDLKHDPSTGASTGVCFVSFVQDYDEDIKIIGDIDESKAQRGDLAAKDARTKLASQRLGSEVVQVVLDDAEGTAFRQTYRALLAKKMEALRLAMKRESSSSASADNALASASASRAVQSPRVSSLSSSSAMRPPEPPRAPKSLMSTVKSSSINGRVSGGTSPAVSPYSRRDSGISGSQYRRESLSSVTPRSHREERARDEREERRERNAPPTYAERWDDENSTLERLVRNNRPYAFVPRIRSSNITSDNITMLFIHHRPEWIRQVEAGWYVAFRGREDARQARNALNGATLSGYRITVDVYSVEDAEYALSRGQRKTEQKRSIEANVSPEKLQWIDDEELLKDSKLLFLYELGNSFVRDILSRVFNNYTSEFLRPDGPAAKLLQEALSKKDDGLDDGMDIDIDLDAERPKTFNRAAREEQRQRKIAMQRESERRQKELQKKLENAEKEDSDEEALSEADSFEDRGKESKAVLKKVAKEKTKPSKQLDPPKKKKTPRAPSPPVDPFASGLAEEEEDLFFCRMALEMLQRGESVDDIQDDHWHPGDADDPSSDSVLPIHESGSARTEGFYRVPPAEKGRHLADRNLGSDEIEIAPASIVGLASARDNRADSRRFVQGIEQHKKETATDTDILKFNQLRSRKKQLKFAKSPIHDWGLYAMETIPAGDMVIEYVGEIVRQQVADEREKTYERQGNFSTYLFRVDDDIVVDATKKGNIARLMNHCCTPNCNAKILTLNGEKRIVLYAKQTILPGQELTYDYKFQGTGDDEDAIACLCGSSGCRGFL